MGSAREQELGQLAREAGDGWLLLAQLARVIVLAVRAQLALEVGIGPGVVTAWIADALERTGGRLVALEWKSETIERVVERLDALGLAERVQILEGDAHQTIRTVAGPIDVLWLAAERSGYADYLRAVKGKLRPGAAVIAEGMANEGTRALREELSREGEFVTVELPVRGSALIGIYWPERVRALSS